MLVVRPRRQVFVLPCALLMLLPDIDSRSQRQRENRQRNEVKPRERDT